MIFFVIQVDPSYDPTGGIHVFFFIFVIDGVVCVCDRNSLFHFTIVT